MFRRQACAAFLVVALTGTASATSGADEFRVVVHPSVRGTWISRAALAALFTRRTDRWAGDKTDAKPVDQSANSPVRRAFTTSVLGLSIGEVQRFWQNRVAAQRVFPPPVKSTDADVLVYVASTAGAVGYVGADAAIPEGVKVVSIVE